MRYLRLKRHDLFLLLIMASISSLGQDLQKASEVNVIPPSPNVAAFNKFVDIPVSYYTGTPDVTIPLYEIKMNQLSLPITLSYHASGLKVEELASWIGAGWTLNASGVISRTVKGLPDELYQVADNKKGFFHNGRLFLADGSFNYSKITECSRTTRTETWKITSDATTTTPDSVSRGYLDTEPDLYYYNFPGGSGKFTFTQKHQLIKLSVDDTKIITDPFTNNASLPTTLNPTSYEWEMVGEDGVHYKFKNAERTKVISASTGGGFSPYSPSIENYQSSWHLDEISLNGEWIRFYYTNEFQQYDVKLGESGQFSVVGGTTSSPVSYSLINTQVDAKRLVRIETSNGYKVCFYASKADRKDLIGSKRLQYVRIFKDGVLIKGYQLDNGPNDVNATQSNGAYFGNNAKLKLRNVTPNGISDTTLTINGHQFQYYEDLTFPALDSKNQDYWGYYNAAANGSSLLPVYKDTLYHVNTNSSVNREPDLNFAQIGSLKGIIYPTGGYTKFQYELHDYYATRYKTPYSFQATATGGSLSSPVVTTKTFTVTSTYSASIFTDGNSNDFYSFTKLKKWNAVTDLYDIDVNLSMNGLGNRRNLPPGNYQLLAQNGNGGTTFIRIEYEQPETRNVVAGGLRIKHLITYDPTSNKKLVKSFNYKLGATTMSSGVLFTPINLGGYLTTYTSGSIGGVAGQVCFSDSPTYFVNVSTSTQIPLALNQGSHIGYSEVRVFDLLEADINLSEIDASKKNGATIYTFVNEKDNSFKSYPYVPQKDLSHKNGKMISETHYRFNGSVLKKISEQTFDYLEEALPNQVKGLNFKAVATSFCYNCNSSNYASNEYTLNAKWYYLNSVTAKEYDDNEVLKLSTTTNYLYDPARTHRQTIGKTLQNSKGEVTSEEYTRMPGIPALVTQVVKKINGAQVSGEKMTYNGKLPGSYSVWDVQSNPSTYFYKSIFTYSGNQLQSIIANPVGESLIGTQKSYIWGHNGAHVIAEVINAKPEQIYYTSFEENGILGNSANPAKTGAKYWNSNTYNFAAQGFVPSNTTNLKVSYWYWNGSQWLFSGETDWGTGTITAGTRLDEIRVYPKGALMTTYTYQLGAGLASATNSNAKTDYYLYDAFNRLELVKDDKGNILQQYQYNYQTGVPAID